MAENPTVSGVVRATTFFGLLVVGIAVTRPWGYYREVREPVRDPARAVDTVFGIETIAGMAGLGLAVLGITVMLRSWRFPGVLVVGLVGMLIELFGLLRLATYPPEATVWPVVFLGGGALVLCAGLIGIGERVLSGHGATLTPSSVVLVGGGLLALSPLFDATGCSSQCINDLWTRKWWYLVFAVPLGLVLVLTRTPGYWARVAVWLVGLVASVTGLGLTYHLVTSPVHGNDLPVVTFTAVGILGAYTILLGGTYAFVAYVDAHT